LQTLDREGRPMTRPFSPSSRYRLPLFPVSNDRSFFSFPLFPLRPRIFPILVHSWCFLFLLSRCSIFMDLSLACFFCVCEEYLSMVFPCSGSFFFYRCPSTRSVSFAAFLRCVERYHPCALFSFDSLPIKLLCPFLRSSFAIAGSSSGDFLLWP